MPPKKIGNLDVSSEARERCKARVSETINYIAQGIPTSEIVKVLCTNHGVNWRTAYTDVSRARKRLGQACAKRGTDEAIGEAISRAEQHYVRCIKAGDLATGLATLKHLAALSGALQLVDGRMAQALKVQVEGGTKTRPAAITVEAFNAARSVFGIPPLNEDQFDHYRRSHSRKQVFALPNGRNGSNGSNGSGR